MTEGFFSLLDRDDALRKVGSVGAAPPFIEIIVLRENVEDCTAGEIGEICGRGLMMISGYYKQPRINQKNNC